MMKALNFDSVRFPSCISGVPEQPGLGRGAAFCRGSRSAITSAVPHSLIHSTDNLPVAARIARDAHAVRGCAPRKPRVELEGRRVS